MIRFLVGSPMSLATEILALYPELGAARYRSGGLPVRVGGWMLGQRRVNAITLWGTIFVGTARPSAGLFLHELRHVQQFRESWTFPFRYIWESMRHGYYNNRFERDADSFALRKLNEAYYAKRGTE